MSTRTSTRAKILATVAVISGTAAVAGLGTFGTFTNTTTAQAQTDAAGAVTLDFAGTAPQTNRLAVSSGLMAAGDTVQRSFTLHNAGTLNMASVAFNVSVGTSTLLDTDATNGLQVQIQKCSTAWVEAGTSPAFTYTCGGTVTTLLPSTPLSTLKAASNGTNLTAPAALTPGSQDNCVMTVTLPSTAGNTFQTLSDTLSITFTGTQRAAQSV